MNAPTDLLADRLAALANYDDDSNWGAIRRRRRRPAAMALAVAVLALTIFGAGAAFGLYDVVLPFESQPPAPQPVVKDFETFFGGKYAPPGMDPHVLAGEARRVATYENGRHRYVLYVAPTKTRGFCESFTQLFGGCRQVRELPPGAPKGGPDELNRYAIGSMGEVGAKGTTIIGGDLLLPAGTALTAEFADGSSVEIPVTYVSNPIDAGFFLYPITAGHLGEGRELTYLTARDRDGRVLARERIRPATAPETAPPARPSRATR
jgi:hypothetical protein